MNIFDEAPKIVAAGKARGWIGYKANPVKRVAARPAGRPSVSGLSVKQSGESLYRRLLRAKTACAKGKARWTHLSNAAMGHTEYMREYRRLQKLRDELPNTKQLFMIRLSRQ